MTESHTEGIVAGLTVASTYNNGLQRTRLELRRGNNLLQRVDYSFEAAGRLVAMATRAGVGPAQALRFDYDWQGRRIRKRVWDNASFSGPPRLDLRFVYDGWNLMAVLDPQSSVLQSFVWGLDLSGTRQGAGGVGGLLAISDAQSGTHFPAYDGNGNVVALVHAPSSMLHAQYDYGPFGEPLRATGPMAATNPFRFSTKYQDAETGLLYYGYRYYSPTLGRWINEDPLGEPGFEMACRWGGPLHGDGPSLYHFTRNNPAGRIDRLGLAHGNPICGPDGRCYPYDWRSWLCPRNCGPDYTQAVNAEVVEFRAYLAAAPDFGGGIITLLAVIGWFRNVMTSLDYASQADTAALNANFLTGCPSLGCRGTITLCGRCVGSDVPGNVMYGFAVAAVGVPAILANVGADVAEATDEDGEADMGLFLAAVHIFLGIDVDRDKDVFPLGKELYEGGADDICAVLSNLPKHATSGCRPCTTTGTFTRRAPFRGVRYPLGF